ncbi:hypothetical protein BB559_002891 [Furculomyces boomerangus]|uniref:Gem-associated protein 2 n=1 Tax=Furculomyces boomerangus TaxID=61424 RepID=A0A2T9YR98_9FUNG|nr:hypothetical protein BB559_002891 [Furculomyces boomerangus]
MDDNDSLSRQCLPILNGDIDGSFDADSISALQYLEKVSEESIKIPNIMLPKDPILLERIHKSRKRNLDSIDTNEYLQTRSIFENDATTNVVDNSSSYVWDKSWCTKYCIEFKKFNKMLGKTKAKKTIDSSNYQSFWKAIFTNKDLGMYKSNSNNLLLVNALSGLGNNKTLKIMELIPKWLSDTSITHIQTFSIFILLLNLDPLLTNEDIFILRTLARKLQEIRTEQKLQLENQNNQQVLYINFVIGIISNIFGQKDLN